MDDKNLLEQLRENNLAALEQAIDGYSAYVVTVIRNQLGPSARRCDVEELASDVFFTLWQKRQAIRTLHLRGWLGTVARNRARSFLRQRRRDGALVSLEEVILPEADQAAGLAEAQEQSQLLAAALEELGEPDGEILRRFYGREEPVAAIAAQMHLHPEAVKSRLRRGRKKLKTILCREGYEL